MHIRLAASVLAVALVAACGGAIPGSTSNANPPASGSTSTGQSAGQVECAAITTAGQQLFAVQLLAQLTTPDTIEAIRDKEIGNLDLDAFLSAMGELHALDAYTSPLGDPKAAIDVYEKAGAAAKVLFATEPITQAAIDTYNQNVGTVGDFLGRQIAISGAIDEAGC